MVKNMVSEILYQRRMSTQELVDRIPNDGGLSDRGHYNKVWNFIHSRHVNLPLAMLDHCCKALNATPGDILEYIPDEAQR